MPPATNIAPDFRRQPCRVALLTALLVASGAAWSQDASRGQQLYSQHCYICHGSPSTSNANAKGANNPTAISDGIASNVGGMSILSTLTNRDLSDVAAYLGASLGNTATGDATDRVLNWAEATYPHLLQPAGTSNNINGYRYRYYSSSDIYAGSKDGRLYWLGPPTNGVVVDLGALTDWLTTAGKAGF